MCITSNSVCNELHIFITHNSLNYILIIKPTRCTNFSSCQQTSMTYTLVCLQWKTPGHEQRNCQKHVEFYSKNKFEKLAHLISFITKIYLDAQSPEHQMLLIIIYSFFSVEILIDNDLSYIFRRQKSKSHSNLLGSVFSRSRGHNSPSIFCRKLGVSSDIRHCCLKDEPDRRQELWLPSIREKTQGWVIQFVRSKINLVHSHWLFMSEVEGWGMERVEWYLPQLPMESNLSFVFYPSTRLDFFLPALYFVYSMFQKLLLETN